MENLEEYIVTCKSMEDLESLYYDLETVGGSVSIPERIVPVYRRRPLSQNTHYMLTQDEALALSQDLRVIDVKPVKLLEASKRLCSYTQTGVFSKSTSANTIDANYKNWALLRCLEGIQRSDWGSDGTLNQTDTITIGPTGKNVDVIIVDGISGLPNHPEFAVNADGTGGTRYIQYNWFQLNNIVSSLDDDQQTIFPNSGIGDGKYSYVYDSSSSNANHGTHTTGTVAGNTQGWARDANIYQIGGLGQQGLGSLIIWDYIRAFHKTKPINPKTGKRNPTICNCSIGSSIQFPWPEVGVGPVVQGTRRGVTVGDYTGGGKLTADQLNSIGMYNITVNNVVYSTVPYYNLAEDADITQAINEGIIVVASAGNESFFIDVPTGPDYKNTFVASFAGVFYEWNQHQGTAPGSVPGAICVGAVDATKIETKAYYSNTGPRVDIFAPGSWIMSSIATKIGAGLGTISDNRNTIYNIGREIGTSMAAPQVTGILACMLELYPDMTPAQALSYIKYWAKTSQLNDSGGVSPTWTSDRYSLQGAPNRYLYFPKERPSDGEMYPKQNHLPRPTTGILYPRRNLKLR